SSLPSPRQDAPVSRIRAETTIRETRARLGVMERPCSAIGRSPTRARPGLLLTAEVHSWRGQSAPMVGRPGESVWLALASGRVDNGRVGSGSTAFPSPGRGLEPNGATMQTAAEEVVADREGGRGVPGPIDKSDQRVRRMFGSIARRYDLLNHLLSLNIDRWWRRFTTRVVPPEPGAPVLDCCTGTADLALAYDRAGQGRSPIIGSDFSREM